MRDKSIILPINRIIECNKVCLMNYMHLENISKKRSSKSNNKTFLYFNLFFIKHTVICRHQEIIEQYNMIKSSKENIPAINIKVLLGICGIIFVVLLNYILSKAFPILIH